jgi:serine O-acetyltransferase
MAYTQLTAGNINERRIETKTNWSGLKYLWYSDAYRYLGNNRKHFLLKVWRNPRLKFTLLLRLCSFLQMYRTNIAGKIIYRFFRELLGYYQTKYGIVIPPEAKIGCGLYIGHWGGIVVQGCHRQKLRYR